MKKKQEITIRPMGLKERVKYTFSFLFLVSVFTATLIFFFHRCRTLIIDIFTEADTVYYNWRYIYILSLFPFIGYFDTLFFLALFIPLTTCLLKLWYKMMDIINIYCFIAFAAAFPISLFIPFVLLSDYSSCATHGIFSGIQYVKDKKMCEQFEYHPEKEKSSAPLHQKHQGGKQ